MKRTLLILLTTVICLSPLAGCDSKKPEEQKNVDLIPNTNIFGFSEFLDNETFIPGVSQGDFMDHIEKYTYNGEKLEIAGFHYDSRYGGGMGFNGSYYGGRNDYTVTDDEKYAIYSNSFYTLVELDNLDLPYGISFEDTLADAFAKIGIDKDPYEGFVSDEDEAWIMTLRDDGKTKLEFTNYKLMPGESGKALYDYELKYSETYQTVRADGREATVTRYVKMSFNDEEGNVFAMVQLYVEERYERK